MNTCYDHIYVCVCEVASLFMYTCRGRFVISGSCGCWKGCLLKVQPAGRQMAFHSRQQKSLAQHTNVTSIDRSHQVTCESVEERERVVFALLGGSFELFSEHFHQWFTDRAYLTERPEGPSLPYSSLLLSSCGFASQQYLFRPSSCTEGKCCRIISFSNY